MSLAKKESKTVWRVLHADDGIKVVYEGFTLDGKPYGAGTAYFSNGNKYQEGIFGIKGLIIGREYYENGNIRFEGSYRINRAYGPNYPINGRCYSKEGKQIWCGKIEIHRGGVGYPIVEVPNDYGPIVQKIRPKINYLTSSDCIC